LKVEFKRKVLTNNRESPVMSKVYLYMCKSIRLVSVCVYVKGLLSSSYVHFAFVSSEFKFIRRKEGSESDVLLQILISSSFALDHSCMALWKLSSSLSWSKIHKSWVFCLRKLSCKRNTKRDAHTRERECLSVWLGLSVLE